MGSYSDSHGNRWEQRQIDRKIKVAKRMKQEQMRFEFGHLFCEECRKNENGTRLDMSHEISVKEAKETGRTELCWSTSNIKVRCRECHQEYDKLNLQFSTSCK